MDDRRFDALARSLAARKTRRGLIGAAAAFGAAMVGARGAGAQVTQAQCGNKVCKNNPGRCGPDCVCCIYPNGSSRCRPPGTCSPGTVVCLNGQTGCGDACVDLSSDAANCGACGTSCDDDNVCTSDSCASGMCVNTPLSDGTPCPGQPGECQNGACATCLPVNSGVCTADAECCQDEPTLCGLNVFSGANDRCCRPAGGTCTIFTDCCALLQGGFVYSVVCSGDGICGGAGVECLTNTQCASGLCCGAFGSNPGVCCAAGQQCPAGVCTGT